MERRALQAQRRVHAELHQSAARALREHIALASEGRFALARAKMPSDALVRAAVSNAPVEAREYFMCDACGSCIQ